MHERIIQIEAKEPMEVFGINNENIDFLKTRFPKLKVFVRGTEIVAQGDKDALKGFDEMVQRLVVHYENHNHISRVQLENLIDSDSDYSRKLSEKNEIIVYGNKGNIIKARTPNQQNIVNAVKENDLVFALGPAGTGKTYTAVALAVRALKEKEVKRIILTRPAVEAGEHLGFLPGDMKEKLDPYMQPLYDGLNDMIPAEKLAGFIEKGVIQIAPLAFMRGRTLDNAFVILDEAQNATQSQMKMFLTRMGKYAKFVITGDHSQVDLPKNQHSGLVHATKILSGVKGIATILLDGKDVVRHRLVKKIIDAYDGDTKTTITKR